MENTAANTETQTTTYPTVAEATEAACRKCKGSGLFDNGNVAGDCFACGGTGRKHRQRPMNATERAQLDARRAEYANRPAARRAAERAARQAARRAEEEAGEAPAKAAALDLERATRSLAAIAERTRAGQRLEGDDRDEAILTRVVRQSTDVIEGDLVDAPAAPIILVTTGHPTLHQHPGTAGEAVHPRLGRLIQPRHTSSIELTAEAGIPWAADNDCFQGLDEVKFVRMLDRIAGLPGCLFATVPDVVGDAAATLEQFELWAPELERRGIPAGYVAQDGATVDSTPWARIAAVFIGGSDDYKLGPNAAELAREAKRRGKWVHWGRVNTRKRFDLIVATGAADSFDGSKWARWRKTYLPTALAWLDEAAAARRQAITDLELAANVGVCDDGREDLASELERRRVARELAAAPRTIVVDGRELLAVAGGSNELDVELAAQGYGPARAYDLVELEPLAPLAAVRAATAATLPTPQASDGAGGRVDKELGGVRPSGTKRGITLATALRHGRWMAPTPTAADGTGRLLPTPVTTDAKGSRRSTARAEHWRGASGDTLLDAALRLADPDVDAAAAAMTRRTNELAREERAGEVVTRAADSALWPTPKAATSGPDFARADREGSGGSDLATAVARNEAGALNPDWVEWLMGFPIGWTNPAVAAGELVAWPWHEGEPPGIPRTTRSTAHRADRLRALGNALVPAAAAWLGARVLPLLEADR